jgi:hypothetical protein
MRPLTRCNSDLAASKEPSRIFHCPNAAVWRGREQKGRGTSAECDIGARQRLRSEFRYTPPGRSSVCENPTKADRSHKSSLHRSSLSKSALGARMVHTSPQEIQRTLRFRSPCRHLLIFVSIYPNGKQALTNRSRGSLPDHLRVTATVPVWHKKSHPETTKQNAGRTKKLFGGSLVSKSSDPATIGERTACGHTLLIYFLYHVSMFIDKV